MVYDIAVERSRATPAVCYKSVESLTNKVVKPRTFSVKFFEPVKKVDDSGIRVKKSTLPDVGTYEAPAQFMKT